MSSFRRFGQPRETAVTVPSSMSQSLMETSARFGSSRSMRSSTLFSQPAVSAEHGG